MCGLQQRMVQNLKSLLLAYPWALGLLNYGDQIHVQNCPNELSIVRPTNKYLSYDGKTI